DGTVEIINKYSDKITYWVSESDKGIYDAMNKGIAVATGDYIIFMNAGDKFTDNYVLDRVAPNLKNATIITGLWRRCYSNGKVKIGRCKNLNRFLVEMPICHQATFTKLSYHKNNLFDTSFKFSADYDFFYRAWRKKEPYLKIDVTIADFITGEGVSVNNVCSSVMEREKSWIGERNVWWRLILLGYQVIRIKTVLFAKSTIDKITDIIK
ncbi:MAG: glycosyltransferase, partial [Muribaculaceae bacterium]|nr:glycosyltransferase [Muribaculaceae bacterium]